MGWSGWAPERSSGITRRFTSLQECSLSRNVLSLGWNGQTWDSTGKLPAFHDSVSRKWAAIVSLQMCAELQDSRKCPLGHPGLQGSLQASGVEHGGSEESVL